MTDWYTVTDFTDEQGKDHRIQFGLTQHSSKSDTYAVRWQYRTDTDSMWVIIWETTPARRPIIKDPDWVY